MFTSSTDFWVALCFPLSPPSTVLRNRRRSLGAGAEDQAAQLRRDRARLSSKSPPARGVSAESTTPWYDTLCDVRPYFPTHKLKRTRRVIF